VYFAPGARDFTLLTMRLTARYANRLASPREGSAEVPTAPLASTKHHWRHFGRPCGMADQRGHGTIYFLPWLKISLIISLSSTLLATILVAVQTHGLIR